MAQSTSPNLGQQLSELFEFVDTLSRENEDMDKLPFGPPLCESKKGPAKPFVSHTSIVVNDPPAPPSRIHFDFTGRSTENARECPHCSSIGYNSRANLGDRIECLSCGRVYIWS